LEAYEEVIVVTALICVALSYASQLSIPGYPCSHRPERAGRRAPQHQLADRFRSASPQVSELEPCITACVYTDVPVS
jgi:hypothetical protein